MAEIIGNIMILVFKDGNINVTSPFSPMSVLKILGMSAVVVVEGELKKEKLAQKPLITHPVLPDKYKTQ